MKVETVVALLGLTPLVGGGIWLGNVQKETSENSRRIEIIESVPGDIRELQTQQKNTAEDVIEIKETVKEIQQEQREFFQRQ